MDQDSSMSMNNDAAGNADTDGGSNNNDDSGLSNELSSMNIDSTRSKKKKKTKTNTCLCCLKEVQGCSRCTQCETAFYCSRECQVRHWPVQKNNCRDSNGTEDSDEKLYRKAMNHTNQGN